MSLGKRIKQARENAKLTQSDLAKMTGKGFSTIQKYELDLVSPPLSSLQKIANALEIPLSQLLNQDENTIENLINASKTFPDLSVNDKSGDFSVHLGRIGGMSLKNKSPEELNYLIRRGEVSLDKNGKPRWNVKGASDGSVLDEQERQTDLTIAFNKLNEKGQQKAVEQVEDLAKIPDYQKDKTSPT